MGGYARSEGVTPGGSREVSQSRRGSAVLGLEIPVFGGGVDGGNGIGERRVVKEEEVREEKERGVLRAAYVVPVTPDLLIAWMEELMLMGGLTIGSYAIPC